MQKVILIGNLGRDSEITTLGDRQRLTFSLACSEGKGDQRRTTWYDVVSASTHLQPYLRKGRQVCIVGRFRAKAYTTKDGTQRIGINVDADIIEFVGSQQGQNDAQTPQQSAQPVQQQPPAPQPQAQADQNDGLPF